MPDYRDYRLAFDSQSFHNLNGKQSPKLSGPSGVKTSPSLRLGKQTRFLLLKLDLKLSFLIKFIDRVGSGESTPSLSYAAMLH